MIIKLGDLVKIRKKYRNKKIVLGAGTFDLPHAGHILFLEDCKKFGDILVVMVGSDKVIQKMKGSNRPVMNEHVRLKIIDSLKPVDYAFLDSFMDRDNLKTFVLNEAFRLLKPNSYVVNNDRQDIAFRKKLGEKYGVKIIVLPRTAPKEFKSISTTKIIEKIQRKKMSNRRRN